MKNWVEFSLTSFGTLKYDCEIKTREMFNFLTPINHSVIIEFSFLLLITYQQSYHLKLLIICVLYPHLETSSISFEYLIKVFGSLKCFNPVLSLLFIKNLYLASCGSLAYKYISLISGWLFIKFNNAFIFPDPEPPVISILYGQSGIYHHFKLCSVVFSFV